MRKLSLIFSLLLATGFFAQKASAQTPTLEAGIYLEVQGGLTVYELNLSIESQQLLGAGQDPMWSNDLNQGVNNNPTSTSTILLENPVYYWETPALFNGLNFTISGSNNYVTIQNNSPEARTFAIQIQYTTSAGTAYINGPNSATIPILGTGTVYFPSSAEMSWNNATYFPVNPTYGVPTPVLIAVHGN